MECCANGKNPAIVGVIGCAEGGYRECSQPIIDRDASYVQSETHIQGGCPSPPRAGINSLFLVALNRTSDSSLEIANVFRRTTA